MTEDRMKKWSHDNPHRRRASATIGSHQRKGINVLITLPEMVELFETTTHCSICGCKLQRKLGYGLKPNSPSLDRKDNGKDLSIDNVWIICNRCNTVKQNLTMKELYKWCKNFVNKFSKDCEQKQIKET
jgi:hypothetical protein